MTELTLVILFIGLFVFFCTKNFFVQVVAMKLTLDGCFLFLCTFSKNSELLQALAWLTLSVGMILIFLMMVAGLKKIALAKKNKKEEIF